MIPRPAQNAVPHPSPRHSSRFRFQAPALFFPRARLYDGAVELTGWRFLSRYRRRVSLEHLLRVDADEDRLVLWIDTGETLRLHVPDAGGWKESIERQRRTNGLL